VRTAGALALALASALSACSDTTAPGEFGIFRFAGLAKGGAPLNLLPPATDRAGNVYVLYGGLRIPETAVFIGKNGGGWTSGCGLTKGDVYGVHGFVGYDEDHQWYWSGDALVSVSGATGDCHRVLDHDPVTDANLLFRAVTPWVRDAPSRRTLVALVQSPVDPLPYSARIDLDAEILTNVNSFTPGDAQEVHVLGAGADRLLAEAVVLLRYTAANGDVHVQARFFDSEGTPTATVPIDADPGLPDYSVQGFLQLSGSGLVAGLLTTGDLVVFDQHGGKVSSIGDMSPVGVHRWGSDLFLVGEASNRPVVAKLDDAGHHGTPQVWAASEAAAANLKGTITVRDDRALPAEQVTWSSVSTAMGDFPFLHPHTLAQHAPGTTLWLVAGPSFNTGGAQITAFAMAPVGVSYP
jgi:hypothetical protein